MQAKTIALYCFPYSGGGASTYKNWQTDLPAGVQIRAPQLPGREERFDEDPFDNFVEIMEYVYEVSLPSIVPPYALFGHSMGAFIAFELAREIRRRELPSPTCLFVSGANAPQTLFSSPPFLHKLSDSEFIEQLKKLGGPDEFFNNSDLQELFFPLLRTDFKAIESYQYVEEPPLDCPIRVWGSADDILTDLDMLDAWRKQTTKDFRLKILAGKHNFIIETRPAFLADLSNELSNILEDSHQGL